MANPITGVYLNNRYYNYSTGSYRQNITLKNSANTTQFSRTFQFNGQDLPIHTVTLVLENTYHTYDAATNNQSNGTTTWKGVSRLADLRSFIGALGASMPLTFINPYGETHLIVPTGELGMDLFISDPVQADGAEFRVTLTLENVS